MWKDELNVGQDGDTVLQLSSHHSLARNVAYNIYAYGTFFVYFTYIFLILNALYNKALHYLDASI